MNWWEKPYAGGPLAPVKGFPRAIYPPDAPGKPVSADGPDVIAYKRTVSRAGRWKWGEFDDTFSNGFAHGTSPNVTDTGLAGVQRQMHLDATGWVGEKTFNVLRSIRVPQGSHAGEMCMDAKAVQLINQAYEQFNGHEPAPSAKTVRAAAFRRALGQVGNAEAPPGSNRNKYGKWYGMDGVPWCAIFATWCYETAAASMGKDSPSFVQGQRYAYVPYIVSHARMQTYGLRTTDDPVPGDLVCFDWEANGEYDHVGLFEAWATGGAFTTVEGNTSTSNNSNGGQVMRRTRSRGGQSTVFVRVAEP